MPCLWPSRALFGGRESIVASVKGVGGIVGQDIVLQCQGQNFGGK
jgi:hypothetical protein